MISPGASFVVVLFAIVFGSSDASRILSQNCPQSPSITGKKVKQGTVTLLTEWQAGFNAKMSFNIPEDINGWEIKLTFSKHVTNFQSWLAMPPTTSAGTKLTLTNMFWNVNLVKGTKFELKFLAYKSGNTPNVCADLVWNSDTAPATNAPTTSKPTATNAPTTSKPTTTNAPTTSKPTTATNAPTTSKPITTTSNPPQSTQSPTTVPPSSCGSGKYSYNEVLHKSILFYEAERSGKLPSSNRIPWRGDSALGDKGLNGEDLTGGWYDAGDHVKFGFPMAFSTTLLSWGLIEYKDAYTDAGELQAMLDSIKWPLDYFIKAHVEPNVFYGQVGNGGTDHSYWGRPEEMTMPRPAYKIDTNSPGSDLAAETAAAMAAGSIAFRNTNETYADILLKHAEELYQFAEKFRRKYSDSITDARNFYMSSSYNDELV